MTDIEISENCHQAARHVAAAWELLDKACKLLAEEYDDRHKEELVAGLTQAVGAVIDVLVP